MLPEIILRGLTGAPWSRPPFAPTILRSHCLTPAILASTFPSHSPLCHSASGLSFRQLAKLPGGTLLFGEGLALDI